METEEKKRLDYKWVIVALSFLMVFTCLGFGSGTKSLYLSAITEALNLKRSLFSLNNTFRFVTTAVINLFFGALVGKFGARKLIGAGFISLIISMLVSAYAKTVTHFYIGGCFLGLGLSWTTTTMVGFVVNKWCKEHRGTIMGFVLAANGVGAALATQIISPIIYNENNLFGYRDAYKLTALIMLVVGIIVVSLFRDDPKGQKSNETFVKEKKPKNKTWSGITLQEALRTPCFYTTAACIFLTGFVLQGIIGTAAAHMKDVGLDASHVATMLSIHSLALAGFKFLVGVLHDHIGLKKTMLISYAASVVALLLLLTVKATASGVVMAISYAVLSALAMPLETIMLPLITADLFGEKAFSKILGIIVSINTAGYALGNPAFDLVFDICGSYKPMYIVVAVVMAFVTGLFMWNLSAADKMRMRVEER